MRFDVDTGTETTLSHVGIRSSDFMVYDIHNDRLDFTTRDAGLVLVSIDPESGALSTLGRPMFETNGTNPRLGVDDAGQIYLLASVHRSPGNGLKDMVNDVFTRLGLPAIAADAPVTLESRYWADSTMPVTLASTLTVGAQLVAYDSHGDSQGAATPEPTPLTITVNNPDAVLSITTLGENFRIQVAKRWRQVQEPTDLRWPRDHHRVCSRLEGASLDHHHDWQVAPPGFAGSPVPCTSHVHHAGYRRPTRTD